jgi:hypothetical protein
MVGVAQVSVFQQLSDVRRRVRADRKRLTPYTFRCPHYHEQHPDGAIIDRLPDNSTSIHACPVCGREYLLQVEDGSPSMLGLPKDAPAQG